MNGPVLLGVIGAAIGGALGGAGGALLAWAIGKARGRAGAGRSRIAIATGIVCAAAVGGLAPKLLQPTIEQQLDQGNPLFATLHRHYPAEYAKIVETMKGGIPDNIAFHNQTAPVISQIVHSRIQQLDDDSASKLFTLAIEEATLLRDRDPISCLSLLAGGTTRIDLASVMPAEMKRHDEATSVAVLEQLATRPASPVQPLAAERQRELGVAALGSLSQGDRDLVAAQFQNRRQPANDAEARAMCLFNIAIFNTALNGPPGTIRGILASQAH